MEDTIFLQSESKPTTKAEPKKEVKAKTNEMNVYQKLAIARAELGNRPLKKSGFNKYSGFTYFELSDFISEITKIFKDLNLVSVFKIKSNDLGIETAYMDIVNADNPNDIVSFEASTAEAAVKNASTIQLLGAKHTYMRRYLWLEAMEIAENDTQDAQDKSKEEKPTTQKQLALASLGQVKILSAQDPERIKKMLDYYGVKEIKELTMLQASEAVKAFSKDKKEEEKPNE
ncbi:ERF family protein [Solobacterium moorei]|uniref:ERF family protein n=1 Tax=Solobacterium moorei TaxID=102148 RepID=UPI0023EF6502|nr:ERF family protein [Solobacterium moorei]